MITLLQKPQHVVYSHFSDVWENLLCSYNHKNNRKATGEDAYKPMLALQTTTCRHQTVTLTKTEAGLAQKQNLWSVLIKKK